MNYIIFFHVNDIVLPCHADFKIFKDFHELDQSPYPLVNHFFNIFEIQRVILQRFNLSLICIGNRMGPSKIKD